MATMLRNDHWYHYKRFSDESDADGEDGYNDDGKATSLIIK